jgi:hypothetical protein
MRILPALTAILLSTACGLGAFGLADESERRSQFDAPISRDRH